MNKFCIIQEGFSSLWLNYSKKISFFEGHFEILHELSEVPQCYLLLLCSNNLQNDILVTIIFIIDDLD